MARGLPVAAGGLIEDHVVQMLFFTLRLSRVSGTVIVTK